MVQGKRNHNSKHAAGLNDTYSAQILEPTPLFSRLHKLDPSHKHALNLKRIAPAARPYNFQLDRRGKFLHNVFFNDQEGFTGFHDHIPTHPVAFNIYTVGTQNFGLVRGAQFKALKRLCILKNMTCELNYAPCSTKANDLNIPDVPMQVSWLLP